MHALRLFLIPLVFLGSLVFFAQTLSGFFSYSNVPCTLGACPDTIHERDSEKVFTYPNATEFTVRLDERKNSYKDLHCSPTGVIEEVSLIPQSPYYTAAFRSVAPGACRLESSNFSAIIVIQ